MRYYNKSRLEILRAKLTGEMHLDHNQLTISGTLWNVMDRIGFNCVGDAGAKRQNGQVEPI